MNNFDYGMICRACLSLSSDVPLEPLFDCSNIDIFNSCTSLGAVKGDNFPQQICTVCIMKCWDWFHFKKQCETSWEKLLGKSSEYLVEADEYSGLNYNDIIALSPDDSMQANTLIGNLSDEECMTNSQEETEETVETFGDNHTCTKCGLQLQNAVKLAKHRALMHPLSFTEVCYICKKKFESLRSLRRHRQKHFNKDDQKQCTLCDKKFKYSTSLNLHLKKHQDRNYVCQICSRAFFTNGQLEAHKTVHQSEKPFSCYCGKSFKTQNMLRNHQQRHTEEADKKFKCENCQKKFITNAELILHKRSHSNTKPFNCGECGRAFKTLSYLSQHLKGHNATTAHSCSICKKNFKHMNVLNNHMKIHTKLHKTT